MATTRRRTRRQPPMPVMMAELAVASAQTIAHRTTLAVTGRCTHAEYSKMVVEKMTAMALLTPWHRAATRNSRRLGRK